MTNLTCISRVFNSRESDFLTISQNQNTMPNTCSCQDTSQTVEIKCSHCETKMTVPMDEVERQMKCPVHHAPCPGCYGGQRKLCDACKAEGYTFKANGMGFMVVKE